MTALLGLLLLGLLLSTAVPHLLARSRWPEREPVLALAVWQCLVIAVLLCCALSLLLAASAALPALRPLVFAGAPHGVEAAYGFSGTEAWGRLSAVLLGWGALRTARSLITEVRGARAVRSRRQAELLRLAPELPPGAGHPTRQREQLVVLENGTPAAWSLPGRAPRLVVTTGAMRRLSDRELAAVLSHERGHVRARHHWILQCAQALNTGFPSIGVFSVFGGFQEQAGRLVELAADDRAARRHGRLVTALALVELNIGHGVFGDCPGQLAQAPARVDRLLAGEPRLSPAARLRLTVTALAAPLCVCLLALAPGIFALV